MKILRTNFRLMAVVILVVLALGVAAQSALAQSISVSPGSLAFGVPTGTPVVPPATFPASASQVIVVNIVTTPVTFTAEAAITSGSSDFVVDGDNCFATGTFTTPNSCVITLHYNAGLYSSATPTQLETAVLTIHTSASGNSPVNLSGAYGSIKLFNETNVATPPSATSFTNLYTIASNILNLSCPASPTATLSGTPDGLGNVLVDNYVTLATGPSASSLSTVTGIEGNYPPGNVCSGTGVTENSNGDDPYYNCFSIDYEFAAVLNEPPLLGLNPDTFANANAVLAGPGGIGPISIANFFTSGPQVAQFNLLSSGSSTETYYGNSTLFLATSCGPGALVPGGSITGNPTPVNTPTFDSNPGSNLTLTDNTSQNPPATGTTPVYTPVAVPQQLFYQLVQGTPAAPDVCFRVNAQLDSSNNNAPMCGGVLIQCWDPKHTTLSGDNCDSNTSVGARDLYDFMQFDSPDGPLNGTNYLYAPTEAGPDTCSYYVANPNGAFNPSGNANGACAQGTGPALVMGGDGWLCTPGPEDGPNANLTTCTSQEPGASTFNTATPPSTTIYTAANCAFSGDLAGELCPYDILVQFEGETDQSPGSKSTKKNSVIFPTANHPLPAATISIPTANPAVQISNQNPSGWVNGTGGTSFTATFSASAATYNPGPDNPPANNFAAAQIYSLTYAISTNLPPDPTASIPNQVPPVPYNGGSAWTAYNSGTNSYFGQNPVPPSAGTSWLPLCPSPGSSPFLPPPVNFNESDGIYYLLYYPTDCALAEGLVFNPQGAALQANSPVDWASFPYVTVGVDTVAPMLQSCTPTTQPVYQGWYGSNVTANCTVMDQDYNSNPASGPLTGSGFLPLNPPVNGIPSIQGGASEVVTVYTDLAQGCVTTTATAGAQGPLNPACTNPGPINVSDLAGNPVANGAVNGGSASGGGVSAGPYMIDLQPPVVSGSAGTSAVGGTAITVTYTCNDGTGSGIESNGCQVTGTPANYVSTGCSASPAASVTCGGTIPTTIAENGVLTISGTDNVMNMASTQVQFTVNQGSQTITFTSAPPAGWVVGGPTYTPTATGGASGNPVTFSLDASSTGCTLSGGVVTPSAAGTCVIDANQAGNSNYNAATQMQQTIPIGKASQTITFTSTAPASLGVGGMYTPTATATSRLTVAITLDATSTGCSLSGGVVTGTAVGTCVIDANQVGNSNYNAAPQVQQSIPVVVAWLITPSTYTFPTISVGQTETYSFKVTNNGATAGAIRTTVPEGNENSKTQPPGDPDDFEITSNGCNTTLAAGASCSVTVKYIADNDNLTLPAPGNYAYLTVTNSSKTVLVQAYMTGLTVDPTVTLTTDSNTFTSTTAVTQTVATLSNPSTQPTDLILWNLFISSGGSYFKLASGTNSCTNGATMVPGATCYIYVTFTPPPSGTATETGKVSILSNAANAPLTVSLTGTR